MEEQKRLRLILEIALDAPEDQETLAQIGLLYLKSVGSEGSEIASANVAAPLMAACMKRNRCEKT